MEINRKAMLEKVMGDGRVEHAHVCRASDGRTVAVATNGHAMAVVPVTAEESEFGPLSCEALKAARKLGLPPDNAKLSLNGSYELSNGSTLPRTPASEWGFPDWEFITRGCEETPRNFSVSLNAKLLLDLAQALGSSGLVRLNFSADPLLAVTVEVPNDHEARGIIMPARF